MPREAVIQQRMMIQGHWILPLHIDALQHVGPTNVEPLLCVVSIDKTVHAVADWVSRQARPVPHLSTVAATGAERLDSVPERVFMDYATRALEIVRLTARPKGFARFAVLPLGQGEVPIGCLRGAYFLLTNLCALLLTHSSRSARMGSIRVARVAGIAEAVIPTAHSKTAASSIAIGSREVTP
jgi:hypothetical protein